MHAARFHRTPLGLFAALNLAPAAAQPIAPPSSEPAAPPPVLIENQEPDLTFGGHARVRFESWSNFGFSGTNDDEFLLARLLLHADLRISDTTSAFVELKSAHATNRDLPGGKRSIDVDTFDIQNAYFKAAFDDTLTLTAGRIPLAFGRQRLISPLPWANNFRSFDGGRASLDTQGWTIDAFYTRIVAVDKYDLNDWTSGSDLFGIYATRTLGTNDQTTLDLYYIGLDRDTATFNTTTGHEQRHTVGARVNTPVLDRQVTLDIEAAYQFGSLGSADINAYAIAAEVLWKLAEDGWKPAIRFGFDYASGDDSPGGDVETFNQLFPLGHAYLGFADTIGRQNIIDASIGLTVHPHERLTLRADFHAFWRASNDDAVYNAGGAVVRPGTAPGAEVAQEFDLTATVQVREHLTAQLGVAHVLAGEFIRNSGPADDTTFAYAQLQLSF